MRRRSIWCSGECRQKVCVPASPLQPGPTCSRAPHCTAAALHPCALQAPHSRRLAENVVPDTPVTGLVPPPNTVLSCFTPCGRYLLAFQPVASEVVAYRFKGLQITAAAAAYGAGAEEAAAAAAAPPNGTAARAAQQLLPQQASQSSSQASHNQPQQQAAVVRPPLQQQRQRQQQQQQQRQVTFGDVFEEQWRCCPCPGRQEQICPDFCTGAATALPRRGCYLPTCLPACLAAMPPAVPVTCPTSQHPATSCVQPPALPPAPPPTSSQSHMGAFCSSRPPHRSGSRL